MWVAGLNEVVGQLRAPVASSMLATAGGIVFNGSVDRRFSAYDEMTGKVLWQARLNASPSSSPITYSVGGQQYVAVVTGGGVALLLQLKLFEQVIGADQAADVGGEDTVGAALHRDSPEGKASLPTIKWEDDTLFFSGTR